MGLKFSRSKRRSSANRRLFGQYLGVSHLLIGRGWRTLSLWSGKLKSGEHCICPRWISGATRVLPRREPLFLTPTLITWGDIKQSFVVKARRG